MTFLAILLMIQINFNLEFPEKNLGKSINDLKEKIYFSKRENIISKEINTYEYNLEKKQILFLNEKCRRLSLGVNDKEIITSIFFSTQEKINEKFFIKLVEQYGKPTSMQKMGAIKKTKETVTDSFHATSMITESIDCSFNENPIFIVWKKNDFQIDIKMDYIRDTSLITFQIKK